MKLTAPTWYVQVVPLSSRDSSKERLLTDVKAASQERLKRELVAFLEEVSRWQPLVLFLDDMHWADTSTVDLMAYVGMRIARMRVLIVAAYRPSDLLLTKHPFLHVRQELQARGTCRELSLGFLSAADVETYLALQFPENSFPPELSRTIHASTEGNALFMADLTRYLRDRGIVAEIEGRWTLVKPVAEIERDLPESVRSMIQRKIDQLDEAGRRLAAAAAVQGQEFDSAVVARVLAIDPAECEERLEALERLHGLVRLIGDRELPDASLTLRYSFVHVLYQNALEGSLTVTRKASLSAASAKALSEFYGERCAEVAAELALLFHAARDFARASDHFLQSARNAARVYAFTEGIALCERAIADAEKLKDTVRHSRVYAAALEIGAAYQALAKFDDAVMAFRRAEDAAAADANREGQATALARGAVVLFYAKHVEEAREHARRALDLARTVGFAAAIASSELVLGSTALCLGNVSEAADLLSRAEPVLRGTQPLATGMRGLLFIEIGQYEQSARVLGEGNARARALGDSFVMLLTLFMGSRAQGNLGRISDALAMLDEGCRVADQVGDRYFLPRLSNTRAWLLAEAQNPEAALRHNLEGAQVARGFGDVESECNCHINAAHDYMALGDHGRALEYLREAERLSATDVWFRWIYYPRIQEELAAHWITRGDLKQAARHAALPIEDQNPKRRAWAHKLLGDIAAIEERVGDARGNYDSALQLMAHFPCPTIEWQILKAAANVAGASTRDELLGRARLVVHGLAESIREDALRNMLLKSSAVRALG